MLFSKIYSTLLWHFKELSYSPSVAPNSELLIGGKPCSIFISCCVGLRGSLIVTESLRKYPEGVLQFTQTHRSQPQIYIRPRTYGLPHDASIRTVFISLLRVKDSPKSQSFILISYLCFSASVCLTHLRHCPKAPHMGSMCAATWKQKLEQIWERVVENDNKHSAHQY